MGMSQSELAGAAGLSNAAISRLEHGESNPALTTMLAVARGLKLPPHELIHAYSLAYESTADELKTAVSRDASSAIKAGLATLGGSVAQRTMAKSLPILGGALLAGPAGLVGMAAASAIGTGVFTALAAFLSANERRKNGPKRKRA